MKIFKGVVAGIGLAHIQYPESETQAGEKRAGI